MRSPRTTTKSSPRSPQLEKARVQQQRPNAAKNKLINFLKKSAAFSKVATNHLWLLSTWTGAHVPKEGNFLFNNILIWIATCA